MIEVIEALYAALAEFENTADYDREISNDPASFALAETVADVIEQLRREV